MAVLAKNDQLEMTVRAHPRRVALARQIVEMARRDQWPIGFHVKEQMIVDALGVSRSPVRSALRALASAGVVSIESNRGCFLVQSPSTHEEPKLQASADDVQLLHDNIIEHRLAGTLPPVVTQIGLQRHFGVSRPIVEQALKRLSAEGLVVRGLGRGWSFPASLDSMKSRESSYAFRLILEPAALLLPTFHMDPQLIESLRSAHERLLPSIVQGTVDASQLVELDTSFHRSLASATGNPFLVTAIEQQNQLRHVMEYQASHNAQRTVSWCHEHLAILNAIDKQHMRKAASLMKSHLSGALDTAKSLPAAERSAKRNNGEKRSRTG